MEHSKNTHVSKTDSTRHSSARPTLKTISEISGFAVQTVSRALSDAPDISAKTKKTVREIADRIGYVPDRAGVRLRTGKTNVVNLVLATDQDVLSLTSRLISSIAGGLRGTRYNLVVSPEHPDDDPMTVVRNIVNNRAADVIILNRIQPEDQRVRFLMDAGFPFVTHGRTVWSDQHAYFDYDNKLFGMMAINKLVERGRKRILVLLPPIDQSYAQQIKSGAETAAENHKIELIFSDGIDSDDPTDEIRDYIAQFAHGSKRIDGLVTASQNATMAAVAGLESEGILLGKQIDVFSKEIAPILHLFRPEIISTREDVVRAGMFLAKAALQSVEHPKERPMQGLDQPQ